MRKIAALLIAGLVAVVAAACGSSGNKASSSGNPGSGSYVAEQGKGVAADRASANTAAGGAPPVASTSSPTKTAPGATTDSMTLTALTTLTAPDRKIIVNAQLSVRVKDADAALAQINAAVTASGGYIGERHQTGSNEGEGKVKGRTVTMTLRVPTARAGIVVDAIRGTGELLDQRDWTEDVTDQYVDLEARIKTKEIHVAQLRKLYDKGGTIKELMDLEQEINRVTADLESMKGRFQVLSNRVEFSTLAVTLAEPGAPAPIKPPGNVAGRIAQAFVGSWNGVVNFAGDVVVFMAGALPILALLVPVGFLGYLLYRRTRHLYRRPSSATENP